MTHLHQYQACAFKYPAIQLSKIKKLFHQKLKVERRNYSQHPTLLFSFGGGERDRTDDLLRARQALSQLSYTPQIILGRLPGGPRWTRTTDLTLIRRAL